MIIKVVRDTDLSTQLKIVSNKVEVNIDGTTIVANGSGVLSTSLNPQVVTDLVTLSGVASNSTTLGTFTGTTIADNSTVKAAIQALETAHEALNISGQYAGSAATFAALPTTTADGKPVNNGDWAILNTDDGGNQAGVYMYNGTVYTLAKEIPEVLSLSVSTTNSNNISFTGNGTVGTPLSATAIIDPVVGNALTSSATGLKVLSSAIVKTLDTEIQNLAGTTLFFASSTSTI